VEDKFSTGCDVMKTSPQVVAILLLVVLAASVCAQNAPSNSAVDKSTVRTSDRPSGAPLARIGGDSVAGEEFVIGTGDVLAISVWKETEISRSVPVRPDGRISLPLIGELQASGKTPKQLESEIKTKLKDFVSEPEVTVIVQEIKSQKFNVLGMVIKPGSYPLNKPMTILDAIALCGGFRDFAKQKDIYVLRATADGKQVRLPFNYKDVVKGRNSAQNVELESNDTIVVP
jgi:polysaccharide export outer membrane protein